MSAALGWLLLACTAPSLVIGVVELVYYPLALAFEARRRREPVFDEAVPLISVVVPAYNEARVLVNCVDSILRTGYPRMELVLVDDGSTDETFEIMCGYARIPGVTIVAQGNAGKAAALNTGIAQTGGEILFFVDADGVFTDRTITEMLRAFDRSDVGAVCGNDEPVNLDRAQTHLLTLLTHGTAFVRRALARIGCLSIVSGNCGAFRRRVLTEIGGFAPGFIGEDLELTWRVHRAGYRVNFAPRAVVYAEVPSTVAALWKQRVRWTRGHIQTVKLHRDMLGRRRYGLLGWYLPVNAFAMLVGPVLQLTALALVAVLVALGASPVSGDLLSVVLWLGFGSALASICFAVALDRAGRDLRYLYVLPVLPLFSVLMSLVTVAALAAEARGTPARWNKLTRTGVVSR
ncbi:glycosyltransferase [Actinokineospora sp.]|uniref:glycosyltransferase n=1 Tax=Actinokineospora sp. TaxID=1872133 RepID=UPI004037E1A9